MTYFANFVKVFSKFPTVLSKLLIGPIEFFRLFAMLLASFESYYAEDFILFKARASAPFFVSISN